MARPQVQKTEEPGDGLREKMISVNRVTKVVKGGRILERHRVAQVVADASAGDVARAAAAAPAN